jgi:type II secretory pathway component GspD/PulD (secretin)/tetratricopeptide (TPR) repeat protein
MGVSVSIFWVGGYCGFIELIIIVSGGLLVSTQSFFGVRRVGVVVLLLAMLFVLTGSSQVYAAASEAQAKQQKADTALNVVQEYIKRGLYPQALVNLATIEKDYGAYLSESQKQQAKDLASTIQTAITEREKIAAIMKQVDECTAKGDDVEAQKLLLQVQANSYTNDMEKKVIAASLEKVNSNLATAEKALQALEQSAAPVEVNVVAEAVTEVVAVEQPQEVTVTAPTEVKVEVVDIPQSELAATSPAEIKVEVADATSPAAVETSGTAVSAGQENSYLTEVKRKRAVQVSYTKAVVADALNKTDQSLVKKDFEGARTSLRNASSTLEHNRLLLGEDYAVLKKQLMEKEEFVGTEQKRTLTDEASQKQVEAEKITQEVRQTMESQRTQAVRDYMDRAMTFEAEERYEEALGQIEQLLAIDPQNREALIKKRTLENTVRWIEQLRIKKESEKEEMNTIMYALNQSIPYSKEINYPRNWKEISERRDKLKEEMKSPADAVINKLLDQAVNLTALTQETTLREAIEILQNSVDPPLSIVVYWKDLSENAFIEPDAPINIDGQALTAIPLRVGLTRVLESVSSGGMAKLAYMVEYGVITVATEDALPSTMKSVTYDVAELVNPPSSSDTSRLGDSSSSGGSSGSSRSGGSSGGSSGRSSGSSGGSSGRSGGSSGGSSGRSGGSSGRSGGSGGSSGSGGNNEDLGDWRSVQMAWQLVDTIIETIEPESWYDYGGDGRINTLSNKLIVWAKPDVHEKIAKLLAEMRKGLGEQVAIETRFLLVDDNYMYDVGLDTNINYINVGGHWFGDPDQNPGTDNNLAGKIPFAQNSYDTAASTQTNIASSLGGSTPAMTSGFGYIIDDLSVDFMIRASQMHRNALQLTAPKAMVLSGEEASLDVLTDRRLRTDATLGSETVTPSEGVATTNTWVENVYEDFTSGILMYITPTITEDKKYVLLNISTQLEELTDNPVVQTLGFVDGVEQTVEISYPTIQTSSVETRVSVPDRGTVLMGGLTLTANVEKDSGVPILNKIPLVGRLFSNRSEVKDKRILLILVKPTIVLRSESEEDAVSALSK